MPYRLNSLRWRARQVRRPARTGLAAKAVQLALAAALCAGCASTPLPPWVPAGERAPTGAMPQAIAAPADTRRNAAVELQTFATPPALSAPPRADSLGRTLAAPPHNPDNPDNPDNLNNLNNPNNLDNLGNPDGPDGLHNPYSAAVAARFPAPSVRYSSPGLQTGRLNFTTPAESSAWLHRQAQAAVASGMAGTVISIGQTQRGKALEALVLARTGSTAPAALLSSGKPTVLLLGQNSPDEPAATEALLIIATELAQGLLQSALERINVLVLPQANPDAVGGAAANQDHLVLAHAETQAIAALVRDYRPAVVVDVREYDAGGRLPERFMDKFGAVEKFDALLQYATTPNTPELLTRAGEEWFRQPLLAALKSENLSAQWAYTNPADPADKKLAMGGAQPDTIRNVSALKNSIGLLLQSRGAGLGRLHIQRRVHTQVTALSSVLASTVLRAADLGQVRAFFDKEISAMACTGEATVLAAPVAAQYDLQVIDAVTGNDRLISVDWDSSLALIRQSVRSRPCGYWLASDASAAVRRLLLHGVQVLQAVESGAVLAESYRPANLAATLAAPTAAVTLVQGLLDVPRASYYVPLNQPLANLVIAALEPDTPFSFAAQQLVPNLQAVARVMALPVFKLQPVP